MSKIKEIVTAISAGNEPGAVRIKREELGHEYHKVVEISLKCATAIIVFAVLATIVIYAEIWNLLVFLVFCIFFSLIYFGLRN